MLNNASFNRKNWSLVGGVVGTLFQAGRDAVDLCLKTIIPFMAFVTFVIGLILETGVGDAIVMVLKVLQAV